jgi:UDP:flavonoid glycosyltransferase YjiC (YdhE family)
VRRGAKGADAFFYWLGHLFQSKSVMKIGLQTWGSDGDIRPFCALAGGLAAAGHEVTLVASSVDDKTYDDLAAAMGYTVHHVQIPRQMDEESTKSLLRKVEQTGEIILQMRMLVKHTLDPVTGAMFEAATKLCAENDLVIGHVIVHPLQAAAEISGTPYAMVTLAPINLPSRYLNPVGVPNLGPINPLMWRAAGFTLDFLLKGSVNRLRKQIGLKPIRSVLYDSWISDPLTMVGVSPALVQRAPDWRQSIRLTGFPSTSRCLPSHGALLLIYRRFWKMESRRFI